MEKIEVSVVMSEYNTKEECLCLAIESILNQTFKDFEFIIVDDCGENNLDETDIITGNRYIRVRLASAINTLMCYYSKIEQENNSPAFIVYI